LRCLGAAWKQVEQPGKREFIFSVLPGSLDAALSSLGTTSSGWLLDLFFPCAAASGFEQPGKPASSSLELQSKQPGSWNLSFPCCLEAASID